MGGGRAMTACAWEEEKAGLWRERRAKEKCGRNRDEGKERQAVRETERCT